MYVVLHAPAPSDDDSRFSGTEAYGPYQTEREAWVVADRLIAECSIDRHTDVVRCYQYEATGEAEDEAS